MGFFSKKLQTCPICDAGIEEGGLARHNMSHAIPATDGGDGFMWKCSCGEQDGVWDKNYQASTGLTTHVMNRHGLSM